MKKLVYIAEFAGKRTLVTSFSVKKSWETLIDTATIVLYENIPEGTTVTLFGGYNVFTELFRGIVTKTVKKERDFELSCEDNNTLLKEETVTYSFKGGTLTSFLHSVGIPAKTNIVATLGKYRLANTSKLAILNMLKKQGIQSFLRGNTLIVGMPYLGIHREEEFTFSGEHNEVISNDVQDTVIDVKRYVLEGINIKPDNSRDTLFCAWKKDKIAYFHTKQKGKIKTLYFYALSETELKKRLADYLVQRIKSGITGTFKTFTHKLVRPEDTLTLYMEKGVKKILVKSVSYEFSFSGGRQTIEIDYEIS